MSTRIPHRQKPMMSQHSPTGQTHQQQLLTLSFRQQVLCRILPNLWPLLSLRQQVIFRMPNLQQKCARVAKKRLSSWKMAKQSWQSIIFGISHPSILQTLLHRERTGTTNPTPRLLAKNTSMTSKCHEITWPFGNKTSTPLRETARP